STAMGALSSSDAPYWAVTEWLPIGAKTTDDWYAALRNVLAIDRCRYVCAYNWRKIKTDTVALEGIRRALATELPINSRPVKGVTSTPSLRCPVAVAAGE